MAEDSQAVYLAGVSHRHNDIFGFIVTCTRDEIV